MEIDSDPHKPSEVRFALLAVALTAMAALLAWGVFSFLQDAGQIQKAAAASPVTTTPAATAPAAAMPVVARQSLRYVVRLAWACLAALAVTLVLLVWIVVRFLISRTPAPKGRKHTPYVDAWKLAGERFKLEEHEEDDEDDQEAEEPPENR